MTISIAREERALRFEVPGVALCAACMLLAGCWLSGCSSGKGEGEAAPSVSVQVATVESKAIQQKVSADAVLYPLEQAAIVPKITAPVKKFYVNRGSAVHAGQLLAELESRDLSGAVTENQGGYIQAQAGYDAAVQKAQQDLELAKQELDAAQKLYDSRQALYKQGAVSGKDVDDASVSLTQARNQYGVAQKQFDLKTAEGQLTAAKGKSASADAALSYSKIVSPIDGVVTDRPFNPGETPPAGSALITIMNLSQVVARAHISPQEAASMKVGDASTVSMPGVSGDVRGKVTLVSPALDPNSTTVEIWAQSPNPKGQLKPGGSARLMVVTENKPRAVVAPAAALLTGGDGATSVIVLDSSNKPRKQDVKVGIRDSDTMEITDGLKVGDRVVTSGAFELNSEDPDMLAKTAVRVAAPASPAGDADDDAK